MSLWRSIHIFDRLQGITGLQFQLPEWPDKEECDALVKRLPAWNEHFTTYLSPENKGFE